MAQGAYLGFVDPDDYVDLDFFSKLYAHAAATGQDIVKAEAIMKNIDGGINPYGPDAVEIMNNKHAFKYGFWMGIYCRKWLSDHNINFPPGIITMEDTVFLCKAVVLSNGVGQIFDTYYNYIRREGSLDPQVLDIEKLHSKIKAATLIIDFLNENVKDPELYTHYFEYRFNSALRLLSRNNTFEGQMVIVRGAIEMYEKCKYKDLFYTRYGDSMTRMLAEKDEIGLYQMIVNAGSGSH